MKRIEKRGFDFSRSNPLLKYPNIHLINIVPLKIA